MTIPDGVTSVTDRPGVTSPPRDQRRVSARRRADAVRDLGRRLAQGEGQGLETLPGAPQQMADHAKAERERWGRLITANGIRLD